ncbi:hypothetical protein GX563_03275 [Candidatus Bathyarchaeota archaeon]|nr:hypothetical protein [Candidatus Bathyarchaeota archaeon]
MQSGVENISALVEELGLRSKAVYLPSSITGDKPKALIPLESNFELNSKVLPKRLIVKFGPKPDAMGLLVVTPGSAVSGMAEAKADYSAGDLESAVSSVLSGSINLADGARVTLDADIVRVEVSNPRLENKKMWVYESLGTPIASIVASVVAEVSGKPIQISNERVSRGKCFIELKMVELSP